MASRGARRLAFARWWVRRSTLRSGERNVERGRRPLDRRVSLAAVAKRAGYRLELQLYGWSRCASSDAQRLYIYGCRFIPVVR